MQTVRRILVAVKDPARQSLPAVDKAAQLALACGADLELFHAIAMRVYVDSLWTAGDAATVQREWRADVLKQLEAIAAHYREQGIGVRCSVEWDHPVHESIVRRARRVGADLIVAECHEGRRIAPWLLHLTDWELLRVSPLPVLLVRSARPYSRPAVLAAVDPAHRFAKPSELDTRILQAASTLQQALQGQLHVVHCYAPAQYGVMPADMASLKLLMDMQEKAEEQASALLDETLRDSGIPDVSRHLVGRHPVEAIPDVARDTRAAIVVMGAVSRSGLKRVFIGNTAEQVLGELPCDLLVVKPARFASRVSLERRRTPVVGPIPLSY